MTGLFFRGQYLWELLYLVDAQMTRRQIIFRIRSYVGFFPFEEFPTFLLCFISSFSNPGIYVNPQLNLNLLT